MRLVTFQRDDLLGEILIDSPPLNLFSGELLADLGAVVEEAAASDIRAVLVRAEGTDFSAGADVSVFTGLGALCKLVLLQPAADAGDLDGQSVHRGNRPD